MRGSFAPPSTACILMCLPGMQHIWLALKLAIQPGTAGSLTLAACDVPHWEPPCGGQLRQLVIWLPHCVCGLLQDSQMHAGAAATAPTFAHAGQC